VPSLQSLKQADAAKQQERAFWAQWRRTTAKLDQETRNALLAEFRRKLQALT
jgi:hypothetical protein